MPGPWGGERGSEVGKATQSLSSRGSGSSKGHGQMNKDANNKWRGGLNKWEIRG